MSANIFKQVELARPKSNTFNLSHHRKFSGNMGFLIPHMVLDVIPGDQVKLQTSQLLRMAPLIAPIMHKVKVYTHFWFVPNRLLWSNWENFITGGENGLLNPSPPTVTLDHTRTQVGSLADYLGLPTLSDETPNTITVSAFPFAAYAKIYNEYYRDQNLITPLPDVLTDGNNTSILDFNLQKRAWAHDYFTSALPWTQKGVEATIPLGDRAPIVFETDDESRPVIKTVGGGVPWGNITNFETDNDGNLMNQSGVKVGPDISSYHYVDLSEAVGATINDLRRSMRLQEWLERNARSGSRYTESILSHFGVRSQDSRLQRPEFIGGGSSNITISEVLQTSETSETPQANMAGHGINAANNGFKTYSVKEHGYIIGILSVIPEADYFQGVPKHYLRRNKFDYYWPSFANLGEQPIENQELYADTASGLQTGTFGYTPRYAEYKFMPSTIHGEFRSTLKMWHLAREFEGLPNLNKAFIECTPPNDIFAVTEDSEHFYVHAVNEVYARRLMPVFGTPLL
jgi:hypothetical protein